MYIEIYFFYVLKYFFCLLYCMYKSIVRDKKKIGSKDGMEREKEDTFIKE